MRRARVLVAALAILTVAAFLVQPALAANAGTNPVPKATGGIALSGPLQYVSFAAFDDDTAGDRGTVAYANFEAAAPGTNVWNLSGDHALVFAGAYPHHMTVDTLVARSTHKTAFTGTGVYDNDASLTWTVVGTVDWNVVTFHIVYDGPSGYFVDGTGTIAADGAVSGSALDSNGISLPWTMPAGSAFEVLSYGASVTCAEVGGTDASFSYTIPSTMPAGLAGLLIVMKVTDGGTPATNGDTYAHGVASAPCEGSTTSYPITSGNLVVH